MTTRLDAEHVELGDVYLSIFDLDGFILADVDDFVFIHSTGPDGDEHCTSARKGDLKNFRFVVE